MSSTQKRDAHPYRHPARCGIRHLAGIGHIDFDGVNVWLPSLDREAINASLADESALMGAATKPGDAGATSLLGVSRRGGGCEVFGRSPPS